MTHEIGCVKLPEWGPAELAAVLPPGPVAILDGLRLRGRPCTMVAWAPIATADTLEEALKLARPMSLGIPDILGAVVGHIAWDGTPCFWLPGRVALFDPGVGDLWTRGGDLPRILRRPTLSSRLEQVTKARPLWAKADYMAAVREAQQRMDAGEIDKVILSIPFEAPCDVPPLTVFRRLTAGAPPGLRFLLDDGPGQRALIGASPEPLVTLMNGQAELHLLAGTRKAGAGLEDDLLSNPKDRAEHSVAVEQSRRDLLAVCEPDSVAVTAFMQLEQHPGLVHLASHLVGRLRDDATAAMLIRSCFPAGTVGGVPRAPAGAVIDELEPIARDWYAGAVGALLPGGDVQLWLTIRSLSLENGIGLVRTGAGLVRESDPEAEWQECCNKARRALAALGAEVAPDAL